MNKLEWKIMIGFARRCSGMVRFSGVTMRMLFLAKKATIKTHWAWLNFHLCEQQPVSQSLEPWRTHLHCPIIGVSKFCFGTRIIASSRDMQCWWVCSYDKWWRCRCRIYYIMANVPIFRKKKQSSAVLKLRSWKQHCAVVSVWCIALLQSWLRSAHLFE